MESVEVTTIAGSGETESRDGVGTVAEFHSAEGICYSEATDSVLVLETDMPRIRRLYVTTHKRKAGLKQVLTAILLESGALAVSPLISIIFDFANGNSTCDAAERARACVFVYDARHLQMW